MNYGSDRRGTEQRSTLRRDAETGTREDPDDGVTPATNDGRQPMTITSHFEGADSGKLRLGPFSHLFSRKAKLASIFWNR